MLEVTRREANHLYTLFHLLHRGQIALGDALGKASREVPIAYVQRHEHDGWRRYEISDSEVRLKSEAMDETFPREDFGEAAAWLLEKFGEAKGEPQLDITPIEGFLDALKIFDLEPQTDDRTHLHLGLYTMEGPMIGIRIQSKLCGLQPLLDGGRTANIKFEQTGVRFSAPAVSNINYTEQPENVAEVARRILYIEGNGGVLKFSDAADKVFKSNLLMIDTNLPRICGSMVRTLHLDGTNRIPELVADLEEKNPLKVKDELVHKHGFYAHKVRELLLALAWGMRPAKQYNGRASALDGYVFVNEQGLPVLFTRAHEQEFADFLFAHARLIKGLPDEDKYGYLERENHAYYLKLNLKIGLKY